MTWRFGWFVVNAALLVIGLGGCQDDEHFDVPAPLWGYITGPDGPLEAVVDATGNRTLAIAYTDSTGRYELPLAAGTYRIRVAIRHFGDLYLASDMRFRLRDADPDWAELEIGPLMDPIRKDVELASCQIRLDGLDFHEGREVTAAFSGQQSAALVSGGSATLRFPLVAEGDHLLEIEGAFVPGTYLESAAERFHVRAGERAVFQTAITAPPAVVQGSVVDPLRFASEIECISSSRTRSVLPDSTGEFSFATWEGEASFRALTENGSFGLSRIGDGEPESFSLVLGETRTLPPFVLPGVSVSPVGKPGVGAIFWIRDEAGNVRSDEFAPYALGPLPVGRHLLGVSHRDSCRYDWMPTSCESPESCDAIPIEVDLAPLATQVEFPLSDGAVVEGRILGLQSWESSEVRLFRDENSSCSTLSSTIDGYFVFRGLHPGSYRLRFEISGEALWYPGVDSEEEAETIEILETEAAWIEMAWPDSL